MVESTAKNVAAAIKGSNLLPVKPVSGQPPRYRCVRGEPSTTLRRVIVVGRGVGSLAVRRRVW